MVSLSFFLSPTYTRMVNSESLRTIKKPLQKPRATLGYLLIVLYGFKDTEVSQTSEFVLHAAIFQQVAVSGLLMLIEEKEKC